MVSFKITLYFTSFLIYNFSSDTSVQYKNDQDICVKEQPENLVPKIPPIKKRRLTESTISAPTVEYISPLESPVGPKRKQATRKSVRFNDAPDKVEFLKPAVPHAFKKPVPSSRPMPYSQHVDKANELLKLILSWNPEWFKTKPEINGVNPTLVPILNNFESHEDYKK